MWKTVTLVLLLLTLAPSCRGTKHSRASRNWVTTGILVAARNDVSGDLSESGAGYTAGVGLDLNDANPRFAVEVGVAYSEHDLDESTVSPSSGKEHVEILRTMIGVQLRYLESRAEVQPYVRAGGFSRLNFESAPDESGFGYYFGTGLDVRVDAAKTFGLFVTYFIGDDDLEEIMIGLSAVFRL